VTRHAGPLVALATGALSLLAALAGAGEPALKDLAPQTLLVGVAVNQAQSDGTDALAAPIVASHFNSLSPENVLKWEVVHPEPQRYAFEPSDRFVALGQKLGAKVIGHVLVWHQQTPAWVLAPSPGAVLDRATLLARMHEHIQAVVGRYRGQVHGWDVVNEALEDDGRLRKTGFLGVIGEDYIAKAFEYARAADPSAQLYYNDYNLWKPAKRDAAIRLAKGLRARGLRVDAIGEQAHWGLDDPPFATIAAMFEAFRAAGIQVMLTELDMDVLPRDPDMWGADLSKQSRIRATTNVYPDGLPDAVQQHLARQYAQIFTLVLQHRPTVSRVTFWGVTDGGSWLNDFPIPGRINYPLLWDRQGRPKPAFDAVVEVLRRDPH
jgi:endo-1,4-beta-xylanase